MVTFNSNSKQLLQTLIALKKVVRGKSARSLSTICEITVTDGKVTFAVPGAIFSINCLTQGTCKAAILFLHFYHLIKDLKTKEANIVISLDTLSINDITIPIKATFFKNDSILRTIQLPFKYTDLELINLLNDKYTMEELDFNKLISQIHLAISTLNENIKKSHILLNQYGVTHEELRKLISSKLESSVDSLNRKNSVLTHYINQKN
ncbi:MAG: hypothetical protein CVU00_02440 [Bacteroidetes bacterium HGW-Bacteroidetes-17]|jgi:hypothetical protein|nr:MAG: hypothetical protein CVU00_02440 [Bacteroidetes bacterium HGW-Bacteroidetes-17]